MLRRGMDDLPDSLEEKGREDHACGCAEEEARRKARAGRGGVEPGRITEYVRQHRRRGEEPNLPVPDVVAGRRSAVCLVGHRTGVPAPARQQSKYRRRQKSAIDRGAPCADAALHAEEVNRMRVDLVAERREKEVEGAGDGGRRARRERRDEDERAPDGEHRRNEHMEWVASHVESSEDMRIADEMQRARPSPGRRHSSARKTVFAPPNGDSPPIRPSSSPPLPAPQCPRTREYFADILRPLRGSSTFRHPPAYRHTSETTP